MISVLKIKLVRYRYIYFTAATKINQKKKMFINLPFSFLWTWLLSFYHHKSIVNKHFYLTVTSITEIITTKFPKFRFPTSNVKIYVTFYLCGPVPYIFFLAETWKRTITIISDRINSILTKLIQKMRCHLTKFQIYQTIKIHLLSLYYIIASLIIFISLNKSNFFSALVSQFYMLRIEFHIKFI